MKNFLGLIAGFAVAATFAAAAAAQSTTTTQQQQTAPNGQTTTTVTTTYVDSSCGTWQGDTWVANGSCAGDPSLHKHERIAGTIVGVKGHLVTVQQTDKSVVINDQPALNNQLSGKVAVGRQIIAHGYWSDGTFYATLLATTDAAAPANP